MHRIIALASCTALAACTGSRSGESGFDCCLIGILVMPEVLVVPEGGSVQLSATGLLDDRETVDLTATATWFSDDRSIASVSEGLDEEGLLQGLSVGTTEIYAAYRDIDSPSVSIQVTDAELQRLSITPDPVNLMEGGEVQLAANALFSDGSSGDVTGQVRWITSEPSVGRLDQGLVEAVGVGETEVHVEWDASSSDPIVVTVEASSAAQPDLVVSSASGSLDGGIVSLSMTIENRGSTSAQAFWLDIFVDPDTAPQVGDIGNDYFWIEYLEAEGSETYDVQFEVDASASTVYLIVDSADDVVEEDESNNGFTASVAESSGSGSMDGPDLQVTYFDYYSEGGLIYYYVDVGNLGDQAAGWFYVDLYLDEIEPPVLYQEGDAYHYVAELSAGETAYTDFLVEESCVYCWSWVQVDGYDSVIESDETNNVEGYLPVVSE